MTLFGETPTTELLPYDGSAVFHEWVLGDESHEDLVAALLAGLEWEQKYLVMFGRKVAEPRLSAWYGDEPYWGLARTTEASPRRQRPTRDLSGRASTVVIARSARRSTTRNPALCRVSA